MSLARDLWRSLAPGNTRKWVWHVQSVGVRRYLLAELPRTVSVAARLALRRPVARVRANGSILNVDLRDRYVGRVLFVDRRYEPHESAFFRASLRPGMTVVDIGANIGYYATMAGQQVGATGRVLAFEPDPHNFSLLETNVRDNDLARVVTPLNLALGETAGEAQLFLSERNFGDHQLYESDPSAKRASVTVRVDSLDAVLAARGVERVDVIKMDVQGFELHVVRGMTETLRRAKQMTILMELWPDGLRRAGSDPAALLAVFREQGFTPSLLGEHGVDAPLAWPQVMEKLPPPDPDFPEGPAINLVMRK